MPASSNAGTSTAAPAPVPAPVPVPAPAPRSSQLMPQKVEVIVPDIVEDRSVSRVNSAGVTVYKQYHRGRYLGKGGFAKCYELTSMDSQRTYAGKVIAKASLAKPSARSKLINEIKIHRNISHQNVVKLERFFEDSTNVYILLEVCPNQTLMELVKRRKRLTETETQVYMWQLVNTMIFLHGQNVIHRDLKLGNLFLDGNLDIRIGDFGLATQLSSPTERKRTICGTPNYIAPEILEPNANNGHSFEVDTWALGVIMYTMLVGQPPFETASVKTTYKRIKDNVYAFPKDIHMSPAARNLITRILAAKPSDRPSLQGVRSDAFFTQSPFPKSLPLTCKHTPLPWSHTCHPSTANQENPANLPVTNTAPTHGSEKPSQQQLSQQTSSGQTRAALTSRHLNQQQTATTSNNGEPVKASLQSKRPATAPIVQPSSTKATSEPSIPSALPPPPQQLVDMVRPLSSANMNLAPPRQSQEQKSPTPVSRHISAQTHTHAHAYPKVQEMKESITEQHHHQRPSSSKRSSGGSAATAATLIERRVTRRSSAEQQQVTSRAVHPIMVDEIDGVVSSMKAVSLEPNGKRSSKSPQKQQVKSHEHVVQSQAEEEEEEDPEERGALRKMHNEIERSFCSQPAEAKTDMRAAAAPASSSASVSSADSVTPIIAAPVPSPLPPPSLIAADLWVNKWVDYSNKYGLGYLLSNGCSGVYFNDSSKAILTHDAKHFEYIERKSASTTTNSNSGSASNQPERQRYTLTDYPANLQKKVTLLKHFMNYLVGNNGNHNNNNNKENEEEEKKEQRAASTISSSSPSTSSTSTGLVYVKKWLRTKHAIFFRLSNRTVQVIFQDHTELLLSSQHNSVTYTDKKKVRTTFPLDRGVGDGSGSGASSAIDESERPDLAKRMKYTKDILHHLLSRGTAGASSTASSNAMDVPVSSGAKQ